MYDFEKVNAEAKQLLKEIKKQTNILEGYAKMLLYATEISNGGQTNANTQNT